MTRLRSAFFCSGLAALLPALANASPCCSGSAAVPSLIAGDDRAQLALTFDRSSVAGADHQDVTQTFRVDGAVLLSDRWQAGVTIPIARRAIDRPTFSDESTALGDVRLNVGWEVLPEWEYSAWKPRGYLFTQLTLPTGNSPYEGREAEGIGRGFVTATAGALLLKRWSRWDVYFLPEGHYGFKRSFTRVTVTPGPGGSVLLGIGFSPVRTLRLGVRAQAVYESTRRLDLASGPVDAGDQLTWNSGADLSYLLADGWTLAASYTDPTLFGPPRGAIPQRSIALSLQCRWAR